MVELSPEEITRRERALIDDYGTAGTSLIQKVGQAAEQAFYDLPDYRGFANRDEYVDVYEQILFGARIEAARTSIAFHREIARLRNKSFSYVKPRPEHYFAKNLRQLARSSSTEPYQMRPFREVYKELSKSGSMTDAVRAGGARARILAQTDVQLARRRASLFARMENDNIVGYIRVLTGAESCGLCYVASTQRYHKGDLNPIHPGCDCGELPIYGDTDPGQVIDQYNLDRIRESFENKFGDRFGIGVDPSARDLDIGKFVQYKDGIRKADFTLVSVREHGELGPILTRRKEKFTTLEDILARKQAREAAIQRVEDRPWEIGLRSPARQVIDRLNRVNLQNNDTAVKKINGILSESLGVETVDLTDLAGLEFEADAKKLKEAAEVLVELQDKYPTPLEQIVLKRGRAYASVRKARPELTITDQLLKVDADGRNAWQNELILNTSSGHFGAWELRYAGDPMRPVIVHEYAHLLDQLDNYSMKPRQIATRLAVGGKTDDELFEMAQKYLGPSSRSIYFDDGGNFIQPPSAIPSLKSDIVDEFITTEVSGYAVKSPRELIAESFAQYELLGEEASPLAVEISETLLRRQKQQIDDIGLDIAKQVTDAEVSDITADALNRLGDSPDVDADIGGAVVQAIRAAGLVKKKTTLVGATVQFVAQEALINELENQIRRQVEREIELGRRGAN